MSSVTSSSVPGKVRIVLPLLKNSETEKDKSSNTGGSLTSMINIVIVAVEVNPAESLVVNVTV